MDLEASIKTGSKGTLADRAWISGFVGASIFIYFTYIFAVDQVFTYGFRRWGLDLGPAKEALCICVLVVTGLSMFITDLVIRISYEGRSFIQYSKDLKEKRVLSFVAKCVAIFLTDLLIIYLMVLFYEYSRHYAFNHPRSYYIPFFPLVKNILSFYMWFGLPYTMLTQALQHDEGEDRKAPALLIWKALYNIGRVIGVVQFVKAVGGSLIAHWPNHRLSFDKFNKTAFLGVLVKLFFIPLMTVFFYKHFPTFVDQLISIFAKIQMGQFNEVSDRFFNDTNFMFRLTTVFFFVVDVGVGWCGYSFMSRWIKNTYVSVEPTLIGWFVAIICYPPFNDTIFTYFNIPSESAYTRIDMTWLNYTIVILLVSHYLIYTLATIFFGLRFSNLTHRGIITKGPYAFVRHPAYAAKNIAWWLAMMPAAIYLANTTNEYELRHIIGFFIGLMTMTYLYYWRAVTEERHLSKDPEYVAYCKKVKYRFIPGVI